MARDEHLGLRFWVAIDGIEVAGFASCSPVVAETETFDYAEGGSNVSITRLPVRTAHPNVTLRRGLDPGQDLYRWCEQIRSAKYERKNVSITIYGPKGDQVKRYDLVGAFPVKWTGPQLRTETGEAAFESVEFAYERILEQKAAPPAGAQPESVGGLLARASSAVAGALGMASEEQKRQDQVRAAVKKLADEHGDKWGTMTEAERTAVLQKVHDAVASAYDFPPQTVSTYSDPGAPNSRGYRSSSGVFVNTAAKDGQDSRWDDMHAVMQTTLHESRHAYQAAEVDKYDSTGKSSDPNAAAWSSNFKNYKQASKNFKAYWEQPIERDARDFAETTVPIKVGPWNL